MLPPKIDSKQKAASLKGMYPYKQSDSMMHCDKDLDYYLKIIKIY